MTKNKLFFLLLSIIIARTTFSCASLSEAGKGVKYATKAEAPSNCTELGEVTDGFMGSGSIGDVKISMRNNTAEMGGNFLVIDTIEKGYNNNGSTYYKGSGRAYKCP
jgi:uncharacterized protein DUF4156